MLKSASVPINWWVFERIDHSKEHFSGYKPQSHSKHVQGAFNSSASINDNGAITMWPMLKSCNAFKHETMSSVAAASDQFAHCKSQWTPFLRFIGLLARLHDLTVCSVNCLASNRCIVSNAIYTLKWLIIIRTVNVTCQCAHIGKYARVIVHWCI